ncbi:MAG TPA: sugar transferase [Solirubrobacterales bacterium]|nr:sugar transferase [Solirubrobacterales bacterium]
MTSELGLGKRSAGAPPRVEASQVVTGSHGRRDSGVRRLLAGADLTGISIALVVATLIGADSSRELLWALPTLPAWVLVFKAYGLYDRDVKRIGHGSVDDLPWIAHGVLLGSLLTLAYFHLTPIGGFNLGDLAFFATLAVLDVAILRAVARRIGVSLLGPERVILVGGGEQIAMLARKMRSHPEYGVEVIGLLSLSSGQLEHPGLQTLGSIGELDLERLVAEHGVERLVVAHQDFEEGVLFDLLCSARELQVKISILPQLFDALGPSVELDDVEGITVLGVNPAVLPRSSRFLKRVIDLAAALTLLVLTAPLQAAIAAAVKLDSPGPALFLQVRIGRRGQRFRLVKFRTMAVDAEQRREELLAQSRDPGWLHLDHDPRVTRVGRFLRTYSLDELPQLWNVLKGEMSLVGPRPIVEDEDRQLQGWRRTRIDLTPGVTGLWQVLGRTNIPFEEMVKLDYLYVTNWSLWTDLRLVLRTLPVVLLKRGAN